MPALVALASVLGQQTRPAAAGRETGPAPAMLTEAKRLVDQPDERVSILDNGLTVILKAHRTAPVVCVQMYCRTGSIYEQEYLGCGLSHLFEHLLHGGETASRTEEQSRDLLDALGGNTNAYTSFDHTVYFIDAGREHTGQAIALLADWITRPAFPQGPFERESEVVQRELERDVDDPDHQLAYLTMETMYREHPVRFPIIGYKPVVQSLQKEDIVGYYRRMYVPDNIVVCVAGDIDLDAELAKVRQEFAGFVRRRVPTISLPAEPQMTTPRRATKRMTVQSAILRLAWPSIPLAHEDLYALDVLSYILTAGDSSRLARTVRDEGLTFTIDSSSWTPAWVRGIFAITARLHPDRIQEATDAIWKQIALLQSEGVTTAELDQAKRQKAAEHVFGMQTAEAIAQMMATDYLSTGDVQFSRAYVDNIQKVTPEQIRDMARKYLRPDRLATITILPEDYRPAAAAREAAAGPEPVRAITLDNGLRCLIRRDPTTPLVAIHSVSLGGVFYESDRTNGFSHLASLLAPRGTPTRSAQDIARFFDSRGGSFGGASGNNTIYFQAQVLKGDFTEALEVFADVVCRPAFPPGELETYRPRVLDQIARINETWRSELYSYFRHRFFTHSPYRFDAIGSADVVRRATPEQLAEFYRQRVTGPQTVLAIFGDVLPGEAEALVRRHFAVMPPSPGTAPAIPPEPALTEPRLHVKKKPPARNVAGVSLGFRGLKFTDLEDAAPVAVLDTVISGYRYPTGWLHDSLRGGDRSYVYEVHAQNVPGLAPGWFWMYAACQPDKVAEVYRIITEQLDKARAGTVADAELERAKTIIITTELMEQQTNSDRAMQAALDELYGLGYDYRDRLAERVRAVTRDEVARVARRYLTTPVIAVVTPAPERVNLGIAPTSVDEDEAPASRAPDR